MTKLKPMQVDGGSYHANTFGFVGIPFKMSSRCLCDRQIALRLCWKSEVKLFK